MPANATSFRPCLVKLARKYAPQAAIGFPPSHWGGPSLASDGGQYQTLSKQYLADPAPLP
jgi:hypothetical protein